MVLEVAGTKDTFRMAWECARPNAIVTIVVLYEEDQSLLLPDMYGKNLTFKTGGVDGCDCKEILRLIEEGKIDTTLLLTHIYSLACIDEAYDLLENKKDGALRWEYIAKLDRRDEQMVSVRLCRLPENRKNTDG